MVDLRLDLDGLARSARALRTVHGDLTRLESRDGDVPDAAAQRDLTAALSDFVSAWDTARTALAEQVSQVADAAQAVHDTFVEMDATLADGAGHLSPKG